MKQEEFLNKLKSLEKEIIELTKQYVNENAPFKVGDIIINEDGVIGKITNFKHRGEGIIACEWSKMLKNGNFRKESTPLSHYKLYNSKIYDKDC